MTSKQVMLTTMAPVALAVVLSACSADPSAVQQMLDSPFESRQVWAVAPLRNEITGYRYRLGRAGG